MYGHAHKLLIITSIALSMAAMGVLAASTAQDITAARQETQIWTTYTLSPHLRTSDLSVSVHEGRATLTGRVNETLKKDLAKQIALAVNGIKTVNNQIVVQAGFSLPVSTVRGYREVVEDASISAAVKSKLLGNTYTSTQAVTVETLSGKVTLTGLVESAKAKELAGRMGLSTRGVVSVDNQLKVAQRTGSASTAGQKVAESWTADKVKPTLLYSNDVSGADVGVSTDAGVVLTGMLNRSVEQALVIELMNNARGVQPIKSVNAQALSF
ncbi:MAG: BON domain-containing protein [Pseudomonas sp.]|uniref:BON domain-containing protein n=1 Tax=Pseudomonas sp. TaxID=306 RepID=UPI0027344B69|nr:BON domain-containing protein [Pseudomonas sp.]MDP3848689.1 BON domain-containing protein [Pseudomonas sp.]